MIDLHMHTTASDGRCEPDQLVREAFARGIHTLSVTDHDTIAAVAPATAAAVALGITCIPGIEITSVHGGRDVHVLAYFLPHLSDDLRQLITEQRKNRIDRAHEIGARLAAVDAPVDVEALTRASAQPGGKSLARPQIAQALIDAGHVATIAEAFDRYLSEDGPAYVPHRGAAPAEVVELIRAAGGCASMAHPGYSKKDEIIPELVAAGLTAIEAYHSSHDDAATERYIAMASRYGLALTGGSDYHGAGTRRSEFFGITCLPQQAFDEFLDRRDQARS